MARKRPTPPVPPENPEDIPLNDTERRFVDEYLVHENATRAYRTVRPDVSYNTANAEGSRLVAMPHVFREIRAGRRAQKRRLGVKADLVVKEWARIAGFDFLDIYDDSGTCLRRPNLMPLDTRKCVQKVRIIREQTRTRVTNNRGGGRTTTTVTEREVEYVFYSKLEALDKLAAFLGMKAVPAQPIEAILSALPADVADAVRQSIRAQQTVTSPDRNGTPNGTH